MKTFYSYTFGCRVNQAETEEIDRQLALAGWLNSEANPRLIIINTCAVTQKAEREARQLIYQLRKKHPKAKIIITGCSATYWLKNNQTKPVKLFVNQIVNNADKENLPKMLIFSASQTVNFNRGGCFWPNRKGRTTTKTSKYLNSGRLLIKIQDGCQRFCSYCIVPYLRGKPKSEKISQIVKKINRFQGRLNEVILTAINTEAYGIDTGESFIDLLKAVVDRTDIPRISLGSVNPWSVDDDFYNFYKKYIPKKRLVDFFHIPLQSGSDKILNLMKRGYSHNEFIEKLETLNKINPFALIATDIIVGFLGEGQREFEESYRFIEKSPVVKLHIFRFSVRKNTSAFYLAKTIKEPDYQTKEIRAKALSELGKKKFRIFQEKHIGKSFSALFINKIVNGYQQGLLNNQMPTMIKTSKNLLGEIRDVKIKEIRNKILIGDII